MSLYGDGSSGSLNVASGSYPLALNTKHQFTDVTIASGATLTTNSPAGSVLYILCNGTFTLNGTINVSNKVSYGNNAWSVTLDGVTYTSPGVANGGSGGSTGATGGTQANGFGGGGAGGGTNTSGIVGLGGNGGSGSSLFGAPGNGAYAEASTPNVGVAGTPFAGSGSAGGGGGSVAIYETSGDSRVAVYAQGGRGGAGFGYPGSDGTPGGYRNYAYAGSVIYFSTDGGGGGGAGGRAGIAGVHVVIKARTLIINGTVVTSGAAGQAGGRGGHRVDSNSNFFSLGGGGGGGGGGGNAGNLYLTYDNTLTLAGTITKSGGAGGSSGGSYDGSTPVTTNGGSDGTSGTAGVTSIHRVVSIDSGGDGGGVATLSMETATIDIISGGTGGGRASYTTYYQTLPQKDYEYRVFDASGNYIGMWKDVESSFNYSQSINQAPSELEVTLGRPTNNRIVTYDYLKDEGNNNILDNNSDPIFLQNETANTVGPDTDVDLNYRVDVYAFYGGYESLLDENRDEITDNNGDTIVVGFGAPNGIRVYSGYIADYEMVFGENAGAKVLVVPFATEMMHYVYKSGTSTSVTHNSTDPVSMARLAMDNYISQGGMITYETTSMPLSGTTSSYTFKLQTTREVVDKTIELLPSGYYHFVHPGENKQYLLQKGTIADHTFYYEKHITTLNLRRSITQLVNKVYFVGGDTGAGDLFKYYDDTTSISTYRPGLKRLADSRVTLDASAQALSGREIDTYAEPRYRTSVVISDAVYDIESISLGEMVAFKNFGSFIDDLLLQIVAVDRSTNEVKLDLDMIVPDDTKRLIELKKNLMSEEIRNIPSTPS